MGPRLDWKLKRPHYQDKPEPVSMSLEVLGLRVKSPGTRQSLPKDLKSLP